MPTNLTRVRIPTRKSLWVGGIGAGATAVIFSAALFSPVEYGGMFGTIAAGVGGGMMWCSLAYQRFHDVDFTRVTPTERQSFLLWNTVWMLIFIVCISALYVVVIARWASPLRALLGHGFLVGAGIAGFLGATTKQQHFRRVRAD